MSTSSVSRISAFLRTSFHSLRRSWNGWDLLKHTRDSSATLQSVQKCSLFYISVFTIRGDWSCKPKWVLSDGVRAKVAVIFSLVMLRWYLWNLVTVISVELLTCPSSRGLFKLPPMLLVIYWGVLIRPGCCSALVINQAVRVHVKWGCSSFPTSYTKLKRQQGKNSAACLWCLPTKEAGDRMADVCWTDGSIPSLMPPPGPLHLYCHILCGCFPLTHA